MSAITSTQLVPQQVSPSAQGGMHSSVTQMPMAQTWSELQMWPQPPQLAASFWRSTHSVPQQLSPGSVQEQGLGMQMPLRQTWSPGPAAPQAPQ